MSVRASHKALEVKSPEKWTGEVVMEMHLNKIYQVDLARELGCTREYVNMILNGKRSPYGAERKFRDAVKRLADRKERK